MKVLIVGNLGAGKTTVAKALAAERNWPFLAIDDCRRRVSDGTPAGEVAAWATFLRELMVIGPAVVEFSGSGIFAPYVRFMLARTGQSVLVLWLDVPPERCLDRIRDRVWDIPYPDFGVPLAEVIDDLHARLVQELGAGTARWPGPVVRIDGNRTIGQVIEEVSACVNLETSRYLGG